MSHVDSNERGSSSRAVLAVLVVLVLLIAGVAYFALRDSTPRVTATADAGAAVAAPSEMAAPVEPLASERVDTAAATASARAGEIPIPVGVRLDGPGRLTGRVLDRANGEGVIGARVDLLPLPPVGQELFGRILRLAKTGDAFASRVEPIATTGTAIDGSFVFEGVRTGTYYIDARGTRHVPDQVARARVAASGDGGPVDVWLRAGGRVVGVVLRPDGAAAVDVQVAITQGPGLIIQAARSGDACYLETRTDENGGFVLCGVPPGDGYDLTASGSSFALSHALDLVVRAGEDTEVVLQTRLGATVEGRIVSSAAEGEEEASAPRPLAGAHVAIVPRGLRDLAFAEELLEQSHCVTDASGTFVMRNVPAGELDLVAVAAAHLPAKGPRLVVGNAGVTVAPDFELPRGPLVSGVVVDSAGAPLEGVTVRWNAVDFQNFEFDFSFAPLLTQAVKGFDFPRTDVEGRFTAGAFAGDPPYDIDFFKSGFEQAEHEWKPDEEEGDLRIVMSRGGAIEGIVMDKKKRAPVASFTIETDDRIETEAGAPGNMNPFSGGILVEDPKGRFKVDPVQTGSIDLTFRAPGYLDTFLEGVEIKEGEHKRGVIVELEPGCTLRGVVVDGDGVPVGGAQVFAVPEGSAGEGGRPERNRGDRIDVGELPPGFRDFAAALGLLADSAVLTKADGRFELLGLEPGATFAFAAHRDFVIGKSERVVLALDGAVPEVEIELSTGGGVFGKALDRFARPVPNAIVIAVSPANLAGGSRANGGGLYQSRTNTSGEYKIERMVGGGYFLVLTRGDEALNPLSFLGTLNFDMVTVPEDELVEYDITDTSSGATRVFGSVLADGEPATGGNVLALGFESDSVLGVDFKIAQIKPDGTYEFVGLAPGEYRFNVDNVRIEGRGVSARVVADVPDLPEFRLDLELPSGAVSGRVVDAQSGEPIAQADLTLRPTSTTEAGGWLGAMISRESGEEREVANDEGEYRFERLQEGEYEIVARSRRWGDDEAKRYAPCEPLRVVVHENQETRDVELKLQPALELAGRVIGDDGEGVDNVELIATRVDAQGMPPERATTDKQGDFRFRALAAGTYDVSASADGYASKTLKGLVVDAEHLAALEIELPRGVEVSVKVLAANGQPVSGATGRLTKKGEEQTASGADLGRAFTNLFAGKGVSSSSGLLALGSFEPGEYVLQVQRGSQRAEEEVALVAGGPVELRVRLR